LSYHLFESDGYLDKYTTGLDYNTGTDGYVQ